MRGSEPFVDGLCFTDVQSVFRELEEVESVLGEAEDIVENSWGAAISFSSSAQFHRQAAEVGAGSQPGAVRCWPTDNRRRRVFTNGS